MSDFARSDGVELTRCSASVPALYLRRTRGVLGVHLGSICGGVVLPLGSEPVDLGAFVAQVKAPVEDKAPVTPPDGWDGWHLLKEPW